MLVMGSEWHLRGQLSEPSRFSLQTLPSVRELIESTDSTFHHPSNAVLPPPVSRSTPPNAVLPPPVSRSTPPTAAPIHPVSATAPAAPEHHPPWNSINHASPHVSPTTATAPSTTGPEQHTYQFPPPRTPYPALSTSTAPAFSSQPPGHSARQDSIFPRFDSQKDSRPSTTSPTHHPSFAPAHPRPNDRPNSSPTTITSPTSASTQAHANQSHSHPRAPTSRRTQSVSHPSSIQAPAVAAFSAEQLPGPVAAPSHSESRTMQELAVADQQGNTPTRQQRFNVRFASSNNYSPTTFAMAPAPKPRSSPPVMPVCPASPVETVESPKSVPEQQPVTTPMEQSKITRNDIRNMTDPAQELSRHARRSPSVERCLGCNEAWKRPLPDLRRPIDMGPTKNGNDLATGNMSIIEQLRAHGRNAEMAHDKWRERHYHCVPRESHEPASKAEQDDARSTRSSNSNGTSRDARPARNGSSKRVRDASCEAEQAAKVRKVTFERG